MPVYKDVKGRDFILSQDIEEVIEFGKHIFTEFYVVNVHKNIKSCVEQEDLFLYDDPIAHYKLINNRWEKIS